MYNNKCLLLAALAIFLNADSHLKLRALRLLVAGRHLIVQTRWVCGVFRTHWHHDAVHGHVLGLWWVFVSDFLSVNIYEPEQDVCNFWKSWKYWKSLEFREISWNLVILRWYFFLTSIRFNYTVNRIAEISGLSNLPYNCQLKLHEIGISVR